ncbi:unnamed protein product [Effrenium voratum]|nr:unnamed protein product [Effrenium voratum]
MRMKKVRENSASLAEINLALGNGGTPLHFAALNGALEIAQMLVQYKANPKAAWGEQSRTPLQLAQEQGHASLVKLLEEIG